MKVKKRNGNLEEFDFRKIEKAVEKCFLANGRAALDTILYLRLREELHPLYSLKRFDKVLDIEDIQDGILEVLMANGYNKEAISFALYREKHKKLREFTDKKMKFIKNFAVSDNAANSTIDDNSNVASKNITVLNSEIHKEDNMEINIRIWEEKLKELYPDFDYTLLKKDINTILYAHDLSSQVGMPYCVAISMYPFLLNGIKEIGGLSAAPKSIESFCGLFINMVCNIASQFKGAVATPGLLICMDWYIRKEWGDDYFKNPDKIITAEGIKPKTIEHQIKQYFQQICYSLMQPSRAAQSIFWNVSIFDEKFFNSLYEGFAFPDGTKPKWESLKWLQQTFVTWLNMERLKCILTFPVVSVCMIHKDGEFEDTDMFNYVAEEYSRGNSFFTYISETADSLSSCCFSKETKVLWKNSITGVNLNTLEEFYNMKWDPFKKNLRIYHNGSWVKGKPVKLPNRKMYKVTTMNNKEYYMTDNHINVTYRGEVDTKDLTENDYLMFNTKALEEVKEVSEHLTYAQGLLVGAFLGDGSFGSYRCNDGSIHEVNFSLNKEKWEKLKPYFNTLGEFKANKAYNNVLPIRISNKEIATFIARWINAEDMKVYAETKDLNLNCLQQSKEFRKGILDGWYITDGGNSNRCYTTSKSLVEAMEILCTSLGLQCKIDISDRTDEEVIIRNQSFNRNHSLYCLRWFSDTNARVRPESGFKWRNNSIYWKIKSIEEVKYEDDVYCIECSDKEEPYFTLPSGLITHNCRLKNKIDKPQFSFTNGNLSEMTGSKNVITLNINRIVQDYFTFRCDNDSYIDPTNPGFYDDLPKYLEKILSRVYKYQTAYNEILKDLKNSKLLTVYDAGFIDMKKQYLTIGINGLTAAAESLGIEVSDNSAYKRFCNVIFSTIKKLNKENSNDEVRYNTELVPAESASIKLYNRDKKDGYKVPEDINLYTSYMFKPYDVSLTILDKIKLHGKEYIGEFLDGGAACHINLNEHLTKEQYKKVITTAAKEGCEYFTFNVPNTECRDCGFITKIPLEECPKCKSKNLDYYDRIIGYLSKISNWSAGRQKEQKRRVYKSVL